MLSMKYKINLFNISFLKWRTAMPIIILTKTFFPWSKVEGTRPNICLSRIGSLKHHLHCHKKRMWESRWTGWEVKRESFSGLFDWLSCQEYTNIFCYFRHYRSDSYVLNLLCLFAPNRMAFFWIASAVFMLGQGINKSPQWASHPPPVIKGNT